MQSSRTLAALGVLTLSACQLAPDLGGARMCERDYAAEAAAQLATIDDGMAVYARVDAGEAVTAEERAVLNETIELLDARNRPVTETDLAILDAALTYLEDEAHWDRADDRDCRPGDVTFSLFCALERASRDVTGEYRHRRTALQETRFAVEAATQGRDYDHRLMDFNNDPETTLEDVRGVIESARAVVAARLELQRRCAL